MSEIAVVMHHRGSDVIREFTRREARRKTLKWCRGCRTAIRIGQSYWDYHGDIRYHNLCFSLAFPEIAADCLKRVEGEEKS